MAITDTAYVDSVTGKVCMRCFVSGRVQGVYYRASTRAKAQELGVVGFARNLPDGRVEVFACGRRDRLEALEAWLWDGPPAARVSDVTTSYEDYVPSHDDFRTA